MSSHVVVLDAFRHQDFIKQQRRDPVTKELLKHGDRIVLCAHCGMAFLEETWEVVRGRSFGHGTDTLPEIEVGAGPTRFGRQRAAPPGQARANGNGAGAAAPTEQDALSAHEPHSEVANDFSGDADVPAPDEPLTGAGLIRLREIPFQLREIPFSLRSISEL